MNHADELRMLADRGRDARLVFIPQAIDICTRAADHIEQIEAKVERLESRGINDMQWTIKQLEAERDRWKKAASGWARKWNLLECEFCGMAPMMLDGPHTECENICEDECLGPCGNSTGELTW
jgi:hypothetical protein